MYEKKQGYFHQKVKSICAGCQIEIEDQYVLRVSSGLEWHSTCLRCIHCKRVLDENDTCFVRNQNIFCKPDYIRLFGSKCDKCDLPFSSESEYVMKLQSENKIFHLDCFACLTCGIRLVPGDRFALRCDGDLGTALLCIEHYDLLDKRSGMDDAFTLRNDNVLEENGRGGSESSFSHPSFPEEIIKREENEGLLDLDEFVEEEDESQGSFEGYLRGERGGGSLLLPPLGLEDPSSSSSSSTTSSSTTYKSPKSSSSHHHHQQHHRRIGRVRTVLSEKQLSVLQKCYSSNPRPDANLKEQMVEMTGLSPRVVRVWFQNKRCKDKKKMNMKKEKEAMAKVLGYGAMPPGVPLVAAPPVLAEADMSSSYGAQIHSYPSGGHSWGEEQQHGGGGYSSHMMTMPFSNLHPSDNNNSKKMYMTSSSSSSSSSSGAESQYGSGGPLCLDGPPASSSDYTLTRLEAVGGNNNSSNNSGSNSLIIGSEA